ncbi:hypothetical protein Pcinc_031631 [Petrolisthes cinctipes]|uniref:Acyl-CoA dehydrogenase n=1 Tax=Petrolisthes cinctipes TaxID=88211 RepID=A0AAE1EVQ0_PETCI|nr:hypothetical protein Pcinc_031631 [Petrolisthes cinctipes]
MWYNCVRKQHTVILGVVVRRGTVGQRCVASSSSSQDSQQLAANEGEARQTITSLDELKQHLGIDFSHAKLGRFTQTPPHQENLFTNNSFLTSYLNRVLPREVREEIWPDLTRFGQRAVTELYTLGRQCELNQPFLKPYDAWGNRTDQLVTCEAWKTLKKISAEEGLIATAYEGRYGEYDRLYQMVKLGVFSPVSGLYSCPLAMTDGAAKTALVLSNSPHLSKAYQHLTSRDPSLFWTSGQWMTEKRGGSDVNGSTETVAVESGNGSHLLFGYKWFSSATDADMALTLAKIVPHTQQQQPTSNRLTMFYLETRRDDGQLNGIQLVRLKDKLGTRQLPTAELLLDGTTAHRVSDEGRGVAAIANMLTITRLHNAVSSCSLMRRLLQLSRDYSKRRCAFGGPVEGHVLHQLTSSRLEVTTRGCEALTYHLVRLLGREEARVATKTETLVLRALTPIAKAYTAKAVMSVVSEALECFGGQGYIEDTGLPSHLRDAQVLPIWEGTTNIMSLDYLRALTKSNGEAMTAVYEDIKARVQSANQSDGMSELKSACHTITQALDSVTSFLQHKPHLIQHAARDIAFSIADIYIGSLLIEHAEFDGNEVNVETARRWCETTRLVHITPQQYTTTHNTAIVMDGYNEEEVYGPLF